MRAAVFLGPGRIEVQEVATPRCDADGILVRVKACGICGSDVRNFRAGLRHGRERQIIGHEIAGVVEEVGSDCSSYSPGEAVAIAPDVSCGVCHYCRLGLVNLCEDHRMLGTHWPGGFAQFLALPRVVLERGMIHRIPPGVSFRDATLAEPLSSVLAAQETAGIAPGQAVAVFGAGAVGCLHVEIARGRGASPIILIGRRRLRLAAAFRPDVSVAADGPDPAEAVRAATGGLGVDVAIIAAPAAAAVAQGVRCVRKRGTVIVFGGLPRGDPFVQLDSNRVHYDELRLVGSFSYPAARHVEALEVVRDRRISADSLVSRVVGLDGISDAILRAERGEVLKVVVDPWAQA